MVLYKLDINRRKDCCASWFCMYIMASSMYGLSTQSETRDDKLRVPTSLRCPALHVSKIQHHDYLVVYQYEGSLLDPQNESYFSYFILLSPKILFWSIYNYHYGQVSYCMMSTFFWAGGGSLNDDDGTIFRVAMRWLRYINPYGIHMATGLGLAIAAKQNVFFWQAMTVQYTVLGETHRRELRYRSIIIRRFCVANTLTGYGHSTRRHGIHSRIHYRRSRGGVVQ